MTLLFGRPTDKWSSLVTPSVLDLWSAARIPPQLLAHDDHLVYLIHSATRGPLVLRLTPPKHRSFENVRGEVEWIEHLAANGVRAARAVPSSEGALVSRVSLPGEGVMYAVAFEKAPGRPIDVADRSVWNASLFERWGALAGRMHALSETFSPPRDALRPELVYERVIRLAHEILPPSSPLPRQLEGAWESFAHLPRDAAHYGLVHGDLHHGNLFLDGETLTVFDFDRSYTTWFVFDIAAALDIVLRHHAASEDEFLTPFLRGYTREHSFPAAVLDALPSMLSYVHVLHEDEFRAALRKR